MKWLSLVALLGALAAAAALAQVSRYIVEDGDGGTFSPKATNVLRGQDTTTFDAHQCTGSSCSGVVPSAATEGISLSGVGSYIFTARLSTGTFSGTGAFKFYVYVDDSGNGGPTARWHKVLGKNIVPENGESAVISMVQTVSLRPASYRLAVIPSSVATSAATPVLTMSLRACQTATCAP
jgi:hypothetical protein